MSKLIAFIRLSRLQFIPGPAALVALGLVAADGPFETADVLVAQAMVSSIQLFAHYVNEHFDADADAVGTSTLLTGGSRQLSDGPLGRRTAIIAAAVMAWVSAGLIVVAGLANTEMFVIGSVAFAVAWWYSAPPTRLVSTGWGEVAVALVVGVLVPLTGAVAGRGAPLPLFGALATPLFLAVVVMLLVFDWTDAPDDQRTGKRTLWIRLGDERARSLLIALIGGVAIALASQWALRPVVATVLASPSVLLMAASVWAVDQDRRALAAPLAFASLVVMGAGFLVGVVLR